MPNAGLLHLGVMLLLVIAAILGCAWLARRMGMLPRTQSGVLRLISNLSLGPRQRIVVVEINHVWLVVGVSPNQVSLLHTLPTEQNPSADSSYLNSSEFAHKLSTTP